MIILLGFDVISRLPASPVGKSPGGAIGTDPQAYLGRRRPAPARMLSGAPALSFGRRLSGGRGQQENPGRRGPPRGQGEGAAVRAGSQAPFSGHHWDRDAVVVAANFSAGLNLVARVLVCAGGPRGLRRRG